MRRREFITLLGSGAATASPLGAGAQQGPQKHRVGVLVNGEETDPEWVSRLEAFRKGVQELGWTPGVNLQLDFRYGADDDGLRKAARELIALSLDLVFASTPPGVVAVKKSLSHGADRVRRSDRPRRTGVGAKPRASRWKRNRISLRGIRLQREMAGIAERDYPRTGHADLPHPALGRDLTPLLSRATPSTVSAHFSELIGCMSFTTSCVCLELRPLPSTGITRLQRSLQTMWRGHLQDHSA